MSIHKRSSPEKTSVQAKGRYNCVNRWMNNVVGEWFFEFFVITLEFWFVKIKINTLSIEILRQCYLKKQETFYLTKRKDWSFAIAEKVHLFTAQKFTSRNFKWISSNPKCISMSCCKRSNIVNKSVNSEVKPACLDDDTERYNNQELKLSITHLVLSWLGW